MKVRCSISGITFTCTYFSAFISAPGVSHPIFSLPQAKLITFADQILGSLSEGPKEDKYLYFLALLNSTKLVIWDHPAELHNGTLSIIAKNLDSILKTVTSISAIHHPTFDPPRIRISAFNCSLENAEYWNQAWKDYLEEFLSSISTKAFREEIKKKDDKILNLLRNKTLYQTSKNKYKQMIADWTAHAAQFPTFEIVHPLTDIKVPLVSYWKEMIQAAMDKEIAFYPEKDLKELLDHCFEHLPPQSELSSEIIKFLESHEEEAGTLVDFSTTNTNFLLVEEHSEIHATIMISAPKEKPNQRDYKTKSDYLTALLNWSYAKDYPK